ncbi:MAG: ABC transporter permease [Gemmatimonadales bacterium]
MTLRARAYALLLALYPADFRARYGRAIRDFHRDRVATARAAGESMLALWINITIDTIQSAAAERARLLATRDGIMSTLEQDLRYAARGLVRRPAFTAMVVATIALGVGANAAIFSVVNGILIRPLPYPQPEQIVAFGHEPPHWLSSAADFVDYRRDVRSLSGLAAYIQREATLSTNGDPLRVRAVRASDDFFPVLGARPLLGRLFAADEYVPAIAPVVVLSYALWSRAFGADPAIVGRTVRIEGIPRTVIGVMPAQFDFPEARTDLWMPLPRFNPDSLGDRSNNSLFMVGRMKPGVTLAGVRTEAAMVAQRIVRDNPASFDPATPLRPHITRVVDDLVGGTRPYLFALIGAVGFVLLIACANVANLLLVRGEGRQKEMALRSALGASGARLTRQLLVESGLLATAGGAIGLLLAWAAMRAMLAAAPVSIPRRDAIEMDWRVVAFTAVVVIATGLLIGLLPARRAATSNAADALKDGGRLVTSTGGARAVRRALVVAEMALAVVATSGAGMLLRSLWNLQSATLGFEPQGVLTARVSVSRTGYDDARSAVFFHELLDRVRAIPGVRAAGAAGWLPVVDAGGLWGYRPEGGSYPDGRWPSAVPQQATTGYFAAMRIPLISGRDFDDRDRAGSQLVAVVSRKFADASWPGQSAIGRRFRLGVDSFVTVVGIVGDFRSRGFADAPEPTMYFPYPQTALSAYAEPRAMVLTVRVDGDPMAFAAPLRGIVRSLDRNAPVSEVRTLEQVVGTSVSNRRFNTALLAGFAGLALLLAGIGTYGVISYGVSQRTFEIGVRMALGAGERSVMALVMSEALWLAVIGLVIGLGGSIAAGHAIRAMLVSVSTIDPPTIAGTTVLLLGVALVSCALPARRALRVNPLDALRGY